jgi:hypothetical protein
MEPALLTALLLIPFAAVPAVALVAQQSRTGAALAAAIAKLAGLALLAPLVGLPPLIGPVSVRGSGRFQGMAV